jgi:hypothetical protein
MRKFWRIVNGDGLKVCDRRTRKECRVLLDAYATQPTVFRGWANGPYRIQKITEWPWKAKRASLTKGPAR